MLEDVQAPAGDAILSKDLQEDPSRHLESKENHGAVINWKCTPPSGAP